MTKLVYMFPGQSSRYGGMIGKLVGLHRPNIAVVEAASDVLGRDLLGHYSAKNPAAYATNQDVQVGVFLANALFLQILQDRGIQADLSLGLSLGEWNHLVHIGGLSFEQALSAVAARGAAYDAGPRGMMVSVYPIDLGELTGVVERARSHGLVEIVNLNSPRQHVLAGDCAAVKQAMRLLDEGFFVSTVIIEREVPMHSSLFEPVGARFAEVLETLEFARPKLPYLPNRLATLLEAPTSEQFRALLASHVYRPVRWRDSIDLVMRRWPDCMLLEVGPKKVLHNLLDRKWHRGVQKAHLDHGEHPEAHLAHVLSVLQTPAALERVG